ncbi:MAG: sulfatase [Planctomycetota bacterium]|jgi:arylsulfatase A-like enzyme
MKKRVSRWLFTAGCLCILICIFIAVGHNRFLRTKAHSVTNAYNVLLISVDTLRADSLNCYGFKKYITSPNIDALAKDGILFENCITASPWTTPSHMSMLTSMYPSTHGITISFMELWMNLYAKGPTFAKLPEFRTTLAEVLKANGFKTAAFTGGGTLEPVIGFDQGFELYDTSMYKLDKRNMGGMYNWIKENSNRNFFLFWHHFEVHAPYLHADFLSDILPGKTSKILRKEHEKLAANLFRNVWPNTSAYLLQTQMKMLETYSALNPVVCKTLYLGGVLSADRWLGQLLQLLKDEDLYDRTLIIFTSDHGEEFADHFQENFYDNHGQTLYEEMIRVPLIIKLPYQQNAGTRVPQVSQTIDFMPTILDFLSITPAKDEMQGISLRPFWKKNASAPAQIAYTEALASNDEKKGLRTDRYKFIVSIDPYTVSQFGRKYIPKKPFYRELYDLREDPEEKKNLLMFPQSKEIAKKAAAFERNIRKHISEQTGEIETVELDQITIQKLKSLGYIDN